MVNGRARSPSALKVKKVTERGSMTVIATTAIIYAVAATAEIVGCFAFWAWLALGLNSPRRWPSPTRGLKTRRHG